MLDIVDRISRDVVVVDNANEFKGVAAGVGEEKKKRWYRAKFCSNFHL